MKGRNAPRRGAVVGAALALLVALPFVGRWEERRNAASQNARMAAVFRLATSGGLASRRFDEYRLAFQYDCLLYHPAGRPSAISAFELCFDVNGRLVETVDRRSGTPRFGSLQEQPALAAIRVPVPRLIDVLRRTGVWQHDPRLAQLSPDRSTVPVGFEDVGAFLVPRRAGR